MGYYQNKMWIILCLHIYMAYWTKSDVLFLYTGWFLKMKVEVIAKLIMYVTSDICKAT